MVFTKAIENFDDELYKNVIGIIFPNLNNTEGNILLTYLLRIIDLLAYCFGYDMNENRDKMIRKLRNENYKDTVALLYLLLPFINDESDKSNIYSLNDIYVKKKKQYDISKEEPIYEYTNLQYGRCLREDCSEIPFSKTHMDHNFYLLTETIKSVSKKLYVNWINVLPYTNEEKEELSKKMLDFHAEIVDLVINHKKSPKYTNMLLNVLKNMEFPLRGNIDFMFMKYAPKIQINEIYETITNFLYYDVRKVKWLIFDMVIEDRLVPLVIYLKKYFGDIMDDACLNNNWDEVDDAKKIKFSGDWKNLIDNNGNTGSITIDRDEMDKLLKSLVLYFLNYYRGTDKLRKNNNIIDLSTNPQVGDDDNDIRNISKKRIVNSANSIQSEYMYDFIRESINRFNRTYYSKYIYTDSTKTKIKNINDYVHNYKLKYNEDWKINGTGSPTLKNLYNYAKSFCHHMDNKSEYVELPKFWRSLTDKFKISVLERLGDFDNFNKWFNINNNIRNTYGKLSTKMSITYISKHIFGVINRNIMDIVCDVYYMKGLLSKINFDSLYNGQVISPSSSDKDIIQHVEKLYSDPKYSQCYYYLTNKKYIDHYTVVQDEETKQSKYVNYMDYNKNSYYNKPYNNSVWYKAYALDWISQINFFHKYLNNRIIYVTGSTGVGKSTQIPKLLLYAMKSIDYNDDGRMVCTQPRITPTQKNADIVSKELGVPIDKLNTDDNINIHGNYYVQYKFKGGNHINVVDHLSLKFVTDGSLNLELSNPFLKKTANVNQKKIYTPENIYDIVAVDEAHEHNANMDLILTYMKNVVNYNNTIKLVIISATMADDEPIYRRYYRDVNDNRMYPLSMDIYSKNIDRINVDRRLHISPPGQTTKHRIDEYYIGDYKVIDPIDIAMDIIKKDPNGGDILLFRSGQSDIIKDIAKLNKILPNNTIALPYYSQLDKNKRNIVENIEKQKYFIKMDKNSDFNEVDPLIGTNSYNRVVIVATNIAEASITIKTLKYVIETGKQKTSRYNYKKRMSTLTEDNISESSRLQRRGRVGRTGPGTVYYTYKKGLMENNKTQYNISIQEISMELYRRLYGNSTDDVMMDKHNDPNNPNNVDNITYKSIDTLYINNIHVIILKQYFINGILYPYYGDNQQYDYNNYVSPATYYVSGFDLSTLNDSKCEFYIIHPEELYIQRNIIGHLIGLRKNAPIKEIIYMEGKIVSKKMYSFWDSLFNNMYIMETSSSYTDGATYMYKSFYGKTMQNIQEKIGIEDQKMFTTYIYSKAYGISEKIIRFMAYMKATPRFLSNLSMDRSKIKVISENQRSDIEAMLHIIDKFHNIIGDNVSDNYIKRLYPNHDIIYLYQTMVPYTTNIIKLKSNIGVIKELCDTMNINIVSILNYFHEYYTFKNSLANAEMQISDDMDQLIKLIQTNLLDKSLSDDYDKLTSCLLTGYSYNIVRNIRDSPYYISVYNPESDNIYTIQKIGRFQDTYVNDKYLAQYLLYINVDIENSTIKVLHYINPKMFKIVGRIYGIQKMKQTYNDIKLNNNPTKNPNIEALIYYGETVDMMYRDLKLHNDVGYIAEKI